MFKTTIGGGVISPAVASHLKKRIARNVQIPTLTVPSAQVGGGVISPSVVAHFAKRNIAKK